MLKAEEARRQQEEANREPVPDTNELVEAAKRDATAAAEAAEWCAKLVAEDDAKKQEALALAGLATTTTSAGTEA